MASVDILIPSSPPRPFTTYNMSSSPLPSLCELSQKRLQLLLTGSRAAPIPQNTSASFTTAASLLKATPSSGLLSVDGIQAYRIDTGDDGNPAKRLPILPKPKPRKPATKRADDRGEKVAKASRKTALKKDTIDGEAQPRKPRKPRVKVADRDLREDQLATEAAPRKSRTRKSGKETNADEESKVKPVRKPKLKKTDGESQTKLAKGLITKSSSKSTSDKVDKALKSKNLESALAETLDPFADSIEYGLVEAVKRRTDWTPPMPTRKVTGITPIAASQLNNGLTSGGSLGSAERSKGFTDLFGTFGFTRLDNNAVGNKSLETEPPRKRKLIELVRTSVSAAAAASPKEMAPKKKARTITDQATSAYAEEDEMTTRPAPLLQYFSYETTERAKNDGFKIPPKPRSKSPVKGLSKAKKGSTQAPILLSPGSALKQSGNQDFVFGTSSQLAREDSPTLLRDLHEAMQASNEVDDDDPFADSVHEAASMAFANRGRAVPSTKRNLWSVAARDAAGELLEVEMVDLVDSPAIPRRPRMMIEAEAVEPLKTQVDDNLWNDVDGVSENVPQAAETDNVIPQTMGPVEVAIRAELLSSSPNNHAASVSSPKKTKRNDSPSRMSKFSAELSTKAAKPTNLEKPDFSSWTTAQLTKEIASYRFKPVKNRDQMITLLEKCWEGKQRIALGALGTKVMSKALVESKPGPPASNQMSTASPKRSRGRPRKDSAARPPPEAMVGRQTAPNTVDDLEIDSETLLSQVRIPKKSKKRAKELTEEISDSDTQVTPSPPRRLASQVKTPPLPLRLSTSIDVDTSPELSPTSNQKLLFTHITRAVKNAPPSKDVSKPSWHEKILLYDPIILEDLTVWLNTGALEKIGWDEEVEPKEVKKWCESKSICCLWKENLRGRARSRY